MEKKYGLSQTEYEIMELFWSTDDKLSFREILTYFNTNLKKDWKKQTLSTFLKILQEKGLIKSDTSRRKFRYYAVHTREEHIHLWIRQLFKSSFENSMKKFMVAFTGGEELSEQDIDDLKEYLSKYENKK